MLSTHISHLFEHPEHLPTVAEWIWRAWWQDRPGQSAATLAARLEQACDPDRIPLSLVALVGGAPVGTVNLVENDSESRPDLTPWLAALWVQPAHRGRGIGSELVRAVVREAARLGVGRLYLGADIPGFYARLGAVTHQSVTPDFPIMRIDTGILTESPAGL